MYHFLRDILLDTAVTGAAITTTATAMPLYPLTHVYNNRPSVPFRSEDDTIQIDIDLGAAHTIEQVLLFGCNLENVSPYNLISLLVGTSSPPATPVTPVDWGGATGLGAASDLLAMCSTFAAWPAISFDVSASCRYLRLSFDQSARLTNFTEIGEIFILKSSWFTEKLEADNKGFSVGAVDFKIPEDNSALTKPNVSQANIDFERSSRVRTSRVNGDLQLYADEFSTGYLAEILLNGRNFLTLGPYGFIPEQQLLQYLEMRRDTFKSRMTTSMLEVNPNGNGKIF